MNIYYSFALQQLPLHHKKYQRTIDLIKSEGHILTREWLQDALDRMLVGKEQPPRSEMYTEIMEAIKNADACIFDITVKSMSIGHMINYALERRNPTLLISDSTQSDSVESLLIAGSKSGYLYTQDYKNEKEMMKCVKAFLTNENIHQAPLRYNLFLPHHLAQYVNDVAHKTNTTKTEVICEAVEREMEKDTDYQKHLKMRYNDRKSLNNEK